jgi:OOP family OmpA-OmpF porin
MMKNLFTRKSSEKPPEPPRVQTDESLNELRRLLVGPLQFQFEEIQELLKNQSIHPEEVSKILPEAIMIRSSRDQQMVMAMEPVVEDAIKASIKKDPKNLVEVLVPVMLPAIKKAIATLIKEMIQSFSATIEHGLSMRGLKWRYEAFKTKKPFGEIALLHSLIYRVEQVFLIHKETGLVLQTAAAEDTVVQDPDMVSSMLTAIQDFVRDSFGGSKDDALENLQFGDRSVWIEQTSQAVIAAVVWGNAPEDIRRVLHETLSAIHFEHIDKLRSFKGDTAPFEATSGRLSDCLRSQFQAKRQHTAILWTIAGLLLVCIGYGSFFFIRDYLRWDDYLERLHDEPGIVITETKRQSGKFYVFGLRDPLSAEPLEILRKVKLEPDKVKFDWELYHSSHPDFIIRRIKTILRPPETVSFELKNNILHVSGAAPRQWLADAEKLVETIPGILGFQSDKVIVIELNDIEVFKKKIENTFFFFDTVSTKIKAGQEPLVEDLVKDIKETEQLTKSFDKNLRIEIIGHTDSKGTDERNLEISRNRAEEMLSLLISQGLSPEMFTLKGVGAREPLKEEISEPDREFNRCVNFAVMIQNKDGSKDEALPAPEPALKEADKADPATLYEQQMKSNVWFGP